MMALWGFYLRRSSITASSRLVSLALNGLGFAALPAMTPLGRPAEPLCLGGAISRNLPRSPAISPPSLTFPRSAASTKVFVMVAKSEPTRADRAQRTNVRLVPADALAAHARLIAS